MITCGVAVIRGVGVELGVDDGRGVGLMAGVLVGVLVGVGVAVPVGQRAACTFLAGAMDAIPAMLITTVMI
jgi:hypothetical protein